MLTQTTSRVLEPSDLDAALAVLDREPVTNAFVTSRVQVAYLDPWRLGGEMWGWYEDGMLTSLCYAGANLVPICATPEPSAPSPIAPAGQAAAVPRSSARPKRPPSSGVSSNPVGAPPARSAPASPSWSPTACPPTSPPTRTSAVSARTRWTRSCLGVRGDVHRGGRGLPAGKRRRPPLPGPRGRTRRRGTLVRASRRAGQGRLQGGDRCGDLQGLSDPGRVGGPEYRGEAWRPPRWQRYSVTPWRTWPPWSASM